MKPDWIFVFNGPGRARGHIASSGPALLCLARYESDDTDPALGYPPGQPAEITLAGRVHGLVGLVLFGALSAAAFVLARSGGNADRGWAIYSRITGVLVIALAFAAGIAYRLDLQGIWQSAPAGLFEHASLLTAFCWIIALAARLRSRSQVATVVAENAEHRE